MKNTIKNSLNKSISYKEYRTRITQLVADGKSSGDNYTEEHVAYTKLNDARMHRLDKTIQVIEEVKLFLENLKTNYTWLAIAESWCGDAAQILPVINKMVEVSDKVDLRIVFRDENEALMNLFLTNGTKSIPKIIIINKETQEVIADFGPRPVGAKQLIIDYKAVHGVVDETAKTDLQKWYLQDKGISIQKEVVALMK